MCFSFQYSQPILTCNAFTRLSASTSTLFKAILLWVTSSLRNNSVEIRQGAQLLSIATPGFNFYHLLCIYSKTHEKVFPYHQFFKTRQRTKLIYFGQKIFNMQDVFAHWIIRNEFCNAEIEHAAQCFEEKLTLESAVLTLWGRLICLCPYFQWTARWNPWLVGCWHRTQHIVFRKEKSIKHTWKKNSPNENPFNRRFLIMINCSKFLFDASKCLKMKSPMVTMIWF